MILMTTLGPKANAVVEAGRNALRGTDADLERIEAVLRARLGADVLPPDAAQPASPRGIGWRIVSPAIGVCVIAGALFLALRPGSSPSAQRQVSDAQPPVAAARASAATIAATPSAAPAATPETAAELAPVPTASARSATSASAAPRSEQDPLAQEVALLSRATTALNSGRVGDALKALDQHQRLFPNGVLSEERRAAKAQALCSSGRVAEGRAQLARISPQSPAGKRAKQVCDSAFTPSP
jgi:hypothetical protein